MKNIPATQITSADDGADGTLRIQYGALCWRLRKGKPEVLLITSRDTGRWIIPKGWPIPELTPEGSAAREAFEEAGVEGRVNPNCIGCYPYDKGFGLHEGTLQTVPCVVSVYTLQIDRLRNRYPESRQRLRKWFTPQKAATMVAEPELQSLLAGFGTPVQEPLGNKAPDAPGSTS